MRVGLVGQTLLEPVIANAPDAPCVTGTAAILAPTDIGPVRVNAANADTVVQPANLAGAPAADGDNGRAAASVTNPVVEIGTGGTGIRITADVLGAMASYTCRAGQAVPMGSSVVANIVLTIGGVATPITLPGDNAPFRLDLPAGLGTLLLNQTVQTGGRVVQRALQLQVPVDGSVADVVIGEAIAGLTGAPCAAAAVVPPANPQCSDSVDNDATAGSTPGIPAVSAARAARSTRRTTTRPIRTPPAGRRSAPIPGTATVTAAPTPRTPAA